MRRIVTKSNFSVQSRKFAPLCWKSSQLQTDLYLPSPSLSNISLPFQRVSVEFNLMPRLPILMNFWKTLKGFLVCICLNFISYFCNCETLSGWMETFSKEKISWGFDSVEELPQGQSKDCWQFYHFPLSLMPNFIWRLIIKVKMAQHIKRWIWKDKK